MKLIEKEEKLWEGPGACYPKCFLENLHAVMAFLVLLVKFSRKFCLNFLTLILSASPNMMHFVRTFSTNRA